MVAMWSQARGMWEGVGSLAGASGGNSSAVEPTFWPAYC